MANEFEQAGIAAYLPGMRLMIEHMQREVQALEARLQALQSGDEYYARLEALQNGEEGPHLSKYGKRIGRPPGPPKPPGDSKFNSWANLPPEEYERRRAELSALKKAQRAGQATGAKSAWARMTPQERSVEMKRRMALWDKSSVERKNQNLRSAKSKPERKAVRVAAAKKAAAARWAKPVNGQAALTESERLGVSPQKLAWMRLSPVERAARAASTAAKVSAARRGAGSKGYWAKLTPEQRSAEMVRRNKVAQAKKAAGARA